VLLLIFILQNTKSVKVSFFTASGSMPLGVALLLAAVGGVLIAGVAASLRIWQLRHRLKAPRRRARPVEVVDSPVADSPVADARDPASDRVA
jgi:uncharacterized integral membrane protein